jgi:hypothetical protein
VPCGCGCSPKGSVEGGVQVTRPGFDDDRLLGSLKQRADLGAPSVDRDYEKAALAEAEELIHLLQLFVRDRMPQVSSDTPRARQTACSRRDCGIDCGRYDQQRGAEHSTCQGQIPCRAAMPSYMRAAASIAGKQSDRHVVERRSNGRTAAS